MPTSKPMVKNIELKVEVLFIKEGEYIIAYCPALELSASGKTEKKAEKAFEELVEIFIEETHQRGTLEKVLLNLGWNLERVPKIMYRPPVRKVAPGVPGDLIQAKELPFYVPY